MSWPFLGPLLTGCLCNLGTRCAYHGQLERIQTSIHSRPEGDDRG